MKRVSPPAALLACALCLTAATVRAQSNMRVGPAADDTPSAAKKPDVKAAPRKSAPKGGQGTGDEAAGNGSHSSGKKTDPAAANPKASNPSPATGPSTASVAPVGEANPSATSDAPSKSSAPPVITTRGTLAAEPSLLNPSSNATGTIPSPSPTAIYHVGVGDVLDIRLLNQTYTRESTLFTVMTGGLLEYPLAGEPIAVQGLTPEEVSTQLEVALKKRAVFDRPRVAVSVREYASHTVLVSGLANDPGVKIIRREAIPLYVVIAESQPKPEAGRAIVMSHRTGQALTFDLTDALALNALVYPGDVVNLTAKPQEFFYIGGEIVTPGQKDFHTGLTLTQAVLASGGATRLANGKVRVLRQRADGLLFSTEYNLKLIQEGKVPDPRLEPGDRVEVERKN